MTQLQNSSEKGPSVPQPSTMYSSTLLLRVLQSSTPQGIKSKYVRYSQKDYNKTLLQNSSEKWAKFCVAQ